MANKREVSRVSLDDFDKHVNASWQALQLQNEFSDVTLLCGGKQIQTHKMIISSHSPVFRIICEQNFSPNPVIYLRGVNYADMSNLINFMYQGQADIAQEDLNSFFAVAEDLEIKGLCTKTSTDVLKDDIIATSGIWGEVLKSYDNNENDMEINIDDKELVPIGDITNIGEDMNHYIQDVETMQNDPTNEDLLKTLISDMDQHMLEEQSTNTEELKESSQSVENKDDKKILKYRSIKRENNMDGEGTTKQETNKVIKRSNEKYQHIEPFKKEILPLSKQMNVKTDILPISEDINLKNNMKEKNNENTLPTSQELPLKYKEETIPISKDPHSVELDFQKYMEETVPLSTELISNLKENYKEEIKQKSKKSLICVPCKTQFASNSDLKQHKETIHANPSLYTCDKCGHKTVHKGNLKKHMESIHEGIRYPCNQCDYKGTQKVSLVLHMKSMHKQ